MVKDNGDLLIVDMMRPWPTCTQTGNRFVFTVTDGCSRLLYAFPIKQHTADNVADCLLKVFNLQGYARNIISDQGGELCGKLMQEVVRLLKFKHRFSTSPHPASHGNIESYNRTIQIMLKSIADKNLYSWDEHIDYALFCYREVKVHGLEFSPFELTFGENRRGPLSLLKE